MNKSAAERLVYAIDGVVVTPHWSNNLSYKVKPLSNASMCFAASLEGEYVISGKKDFTRLASFGIEHEYFLFIGTIQIVDGEQDWVPALSAYFTKADAEWDYDAKKVTIKKFRLSEASAGGDRGLTDKWEQEYNLMDLGAQMDIVRAQKRPVYQVYLPGQKKITNLVRGFSWEIEITEPITDFDKLRTDYHFLDTAYCAVIKLEKGIMGDGAAAGVYYGNREVKKRRSGGKEYITYSEARFVREDGAYYIDEVQYEQTHGSRWTLFDSSGATIAVYFTTAFFYVRTDGDFPFGSLYNAHLSSYIFYSRILTDSETVLDTPTHERTTVDREAIEMPYDRVLGYLNWYDEDNKDKTNAGVSDMGIASPLMQSEPNEYGIAENVGGVKKYWRRPNGALGSDRVYLPVSQNLWGTASFWFTFYSLDNGQSEESGRTFVHFKHCFSLAETIRALLKAMGLSISFEEDTAHSSFLYDTGYIYGMPAFRLFFTHRTNVKKPFGTPARKTEMKLRTILEMLENCYQCYWFIDNDNRLRIEHVSWFKNGGTHYMNPQPPPSIDLTSLGIAKTGVPYSFGTNKVTFDTEQSPARYEFAWAESSTKTFDGYPITLNGLYVEKEKTEKIAVNFIVDIDFFMASSGEGGDGFVMFATHPKESNDIYVVPLGFFESEDPYLKAQNHYLSWITLHNFFWKHDLPAKSAVINNVLTSAARIKKIAHQEIEYTSDAAVSWFLPEFVNKYGFVKTGVGSGQIEEISVNLNTDRVKLKLKFEPE